VTFGRLLITILGVALGVLAVVTGEADDSPGLQLIGVVVVAAAVVFGVRSTRRPPW
jgi:peptidoglycan/LPS O-acetylase OafA/YrhL